MKKLLIGILQHNKYAVTEKCIKHIKNNTNDINYDIFVLDNGSKDGSDQHLVLNQKEENLIIKCEQINHGVIGGRNIIFDYFIGNPEYSHLIFLDNDQFVRPNWIDGYKEACQSFGDCIIGIEAWILGPNLAPFRKANQKDIGYTYVGCGGMMVSRPVVDSIGTYDSQFNPAYFEDPDYCMRAFLSKIPVVWNTKSKIDHLPHQTLGQSSVNASKSFRQSLNKFRIKWKDRLGGGPIMDVKI